MRLIKFFNLYTINMIGHKILLRNMDSNIFLSPFCIKDSFFCFKKQLIY